MTTQISPGLLQKPYRKNVLINGNLQVNQRGDTSFVATHGAFSYVFDRFGIYEATDGSVTVSENTDVPTYAQTGVTLKKSFDIDVLTADASLAAGQEVVIFNRVEGYDYALLSGENATFSFWAKSNKTGIYSTYFRNGDLGRSWVKEFTIDTADTWEKKIVTVPLTDTTGNWDYINGLGLDVGIGLAPSSTSTTSTFETWLGSNTPYSENNVNLMDNTANYFRTTGWQLEKGDIATGIEVRPYAEELSLCQRYFEAGRMTIFNQQPVRTGSRDVYWIQFNTTKRANATITPTDNVGNVSKVSVYTSTGAAITDNITAIASTSNSLTGFHCGKNQVITSYGVLFDYTADAEL